MKSLKKNISSLYIIQFANYVLPLFTLPWLTRTLGPEGYGKINFALAITAILVMLTDYGFNITATKDIAISRNNKEKRSEVYWHVTTIKAVLAAFSGICIFIAIYFIDKLAAEKTLLYIAFISVISSILTPTWYYQGMERIGFISILNFCTRLSAVPLIFMLVNNKNDIEIAMLLMVFGGILTGIIAQFDIFYKNEIGNYQVKFKNLIETMVEGWHIFISHAGVNMYTTLNTLIIGFILGDKAVGVYSAAEKIINAAAGLITPVSQAIFPRISYLASESKADAVKLILVTLSKVSICMAFISVIIFAFSPLIVNTFYGYNYKDTTVILMILSVVPFIKGASNILGMQTMIPFGLKSDYSFVLILSGVISIPLFSVLVLFYGLIGAASSVVFIELMILIWMKLIINKNLPFIFSSHRLSNI